mgnify:CR=1 FL=1
MLENTLSGPLHHLHPRPDVYYLIQRPRLSTRIVKTVSVDVIPNIMLLQLLNKIIFS